MENKFICENCEKEVSVDAPGTKNRNHCPYCLYSVHIDQESGDRKSECLGLMRPVGKMLKEDGEEVLIHECIKCKFVRKNRIAGDDDFGLVESMSLYADLVDYKGTMV